MRKEVLLVFALGLILLVGFQTPVARSSTYLALDTSSPAALHQSTLDCAVVGGSWSNGTGTCTVSVSGQVGSGAILSIDSGATLNILSGASFYVPGFVTVSLGTLKIGEGVNFVIRSASSFSAAGRLGNSELNGACGVVTNDGIIDNFGVIDNSCTFINRGNVTNEANAFLYAGSYGGAGATFENEGNLINLAGGAVQDDSPGNAVLNNTGSIENAGYLQLYSGDTVKVQGHGLVNYFSGAFESTGNIYMESGSTLTVGYGGFATVPTVLEIVDGTMIVPSGVTLYVGSSAALKVDAEAEIDNRGEVSLQSGQATYAAAALTNNGDLVNEAGAIINSNGTITNNAGALINNTVGARFRSMGYNGITDNFGTIDNVFQPNAFDTGVMQIGTYAVMNNHALVHNSGELTLARGASINNDGPGGVLNVTDGVFQISGTVTNFNNMYASKPGELELAVNGTVNNSGLVEVSGNVTIAASATFNNNAGTFRLTGTVTNSGSFQNFPGATVDNYPRGTIDNAGVIGSSGNINSYLGATINNNAGGLIKTDSFLGSSGAITNAQGATFAINGGVVNTDGTVVNRGTLTVVGVIAQLNDNLGGSIDNFGTIGSSGEIYIAAGATLTNEAGAIINTNGGFAPNAGGGIDNVGTLTNDQGATINNNKGGVISLWGFSLTTNNGAIGNFDTIDRYCRAVTAGDGTLTGNPITVHACASLRPTSTAVQPNPYSVAAGGVVKYNVTVSDAGTGDKVVPAGAVMWSVETGGGHFSTSGICMLASGTCAINYTAPSTGGTVKVNATYGGDKVHQPSSAGSTLSVTGQTTTTTTAASSSSTGKTSATSSSSTTTGSSSTTGGGGGIPEFPPQLGAALVATAGIVGAYLLARRTTLNRKQV